MRLLLPPPPFLPFMSLDCLENASAANAVLFLPSFSLLMPSTSNSSRRRTWYCPLFIASVIGGGGAGAGAATDGSACEIEIEIEHDAAAEEKAEGLEEIEGQCVHR